MYNNIDQLLSNPEWIKSVSDENFEKIACTIFQYQYTNNEIYKRYVDAIHINPNSVKLLSDIPFLPIHFFKTHKVISGPLKATFHFESSGTTQTINAKHWVQDSKFYETAFIHGFELAYGSISDYIIMGLLPNYLEKGNSSLVYMVNHLISASQHPLSGFYLHDYETLYNNLKLAQATQKKVILFGVTFALLDFAEQYAHNFSNIIIMETGGMKGRREEWTKSQVHEYLKKQLHTEHIHSEYGMTELFSQGYSTQNEIFIPSPTLKVRIREIYDPLSSHVVGKGALNIIDLANIHSCSFIATEDLGQVYDNGNFKVLGRMDQSALRGCSLLAL